MNKLVLRQNIYPTNNNRWDVLKFFNDNLQNVENILLGELQHHNGIKWYLTLKVRFQKLDTDGEEMESEPTFRTSPSIVVNESDIDILAHFAELEKQVLGFLHEGSGWLLDEVIKMDVNVVAYKPLEGNSYLKLPKYIADKHAVVNVQNNDERCFIWAVLSAIHPMQNNPQRVSHYKKYEAELNSEGLVFPMKVSQIEKFERQNNISINVIGYEDSLFPVYISKLKFGEPINLLLFSNGEKRHYCWIKNMSRLLADCNKSDHQHFHCPYCFHGFIRKDLLDDHIILCQQHGSQKIELPDEENKMLKFKNFRHQLQVPFIIYADFESLTCKIDNSTNMESTEKYQRHEACSFAYKVVCVDPKYSKPPVIYRGVNAVEHFIESVLKEEENILSILSKVEPMSLTPDEEKTFKNAKLCHVCGDRLGADSVRDHCHITGKFRGAAHNGCNLNFKFQKKENKFFIPICFHNLRGYDMHLIVQSLGKIKKNVNVIPNNMERYISMSVGNLRFIDSLQFLGTSLEKLVANVIGATQTTCRKCKEVQKAEIKEDWKLLTYCEKCKLEGTTQLDRSKLPLTVSHAGDKAYLLARKGVYPYDYMDAEERFEEGLPSHEDFYSRLTEQHISSEDYNHAVNIWKSFNCKDMGDYHDLYLCTDVVLLADVFENFRKVCLNQYKLDPAHYYTSPGLFWDAMLKMSKVELELLTDIDEHLFIENNIRGGISMISNRFCRANNKYMEDFDSSKDSSFILPLDANNLYGHSMVQPLPVGEFNFLTAEQIADFDVEKVADDGDVGYILEVDLSYPSHLHNIHSDYPLAPEAMFIKPEMLSPYSNALLEKLNMKVGKVKKLVPNLFDKEKYVLHYRNLKLYLKYGMVLTNIHRILEFKQTPWMKSYILFNTEMRKNAKNEFEKDFFKLANNSVFGRTMMNV